MILLFIWLAMSAVAYYLVIKNKLVWTKSDKLQAMLASVLFPHFVFGLVVMVVSYDRWNGGGLT
tara:strand:- start:3935 stop:4126 length:192 start_codon:yes stop_codon:yes gene_type:complete